MQPSDIATVVVCSVIGFGLLVLIVFGYVCIGGKCGFGVEGMYEYERKQAMGSGNVDRTSRAISALAPALIEDETQSPDGLSSSNMKKVVADTEFWPRTIEDSPGNVQEDKATFYDIRSNGRSGTGFSASKNQVSPSPAPPIREFASVKQSATSQQHPLGILTAESLATASDSRYAGINDIDNSYSRDNSLRSSRNVDVKVWKTIAGRISREEVAVPSFVHDEHDDPDYSVYHGNHQSRYDELRSPNVIDMSSMPSADPFVDAPLSASFHHGFAHIHD